MCKRSQMCIFNIECYNYTKFVCCCCLTHLGLQSQYVEPLLFSFCTPTFTFGGTPPIKGCLLPYLSPFAVVLHGRGQHHCSRCNVGVLALLNYVSKFIFQPKLVVQYFNIFLCHLICVGARVE